MVGTVIAALIASIWDTAIKIALVGGAVYAACWVLNHFGVI